MFPSFNALLEFFFVVRHLGSLIKLAYISMPKDDHLGDGIKRCLQFVKFEKAKINECLDFISTKQLHLGGMLAYLLFIFNIMTSNFVRG